jgi:excisionase family DNA binding protein
VSVRLLTVKEAADRLGISVKTLRGHVRNGRLRYINVGLGERRHSYRIDEIAIDEFKQANGHRNGQASCRFIGRKSRGSINTISNCEVIAFSEVQRQQAGAKPRRRSD